MGRIECGPELEGDVMRVLPLNRWVVEVFVVLPLICLSLVAVVPASSSATPRGLDVLVAGYNEFLGNSLFEATVAPGGGTDVPLQRLRTPDGMAIDPSGDLFVADEGAPWIQELPADGGPEIQLGHSLLDPGGVAVDPAGDLFVSQFMVGNVVERPADGGPTKLVASGLSRPSTLGLDAKGDLFIQTEKPEIIEMPAGGGQTNLLSTGGLVPLQIAVDAAGDVFFTNDGATSSLRNKVYELSVGASAPTIFRSGVPSVVGVAVDATGDLFVDDDYRAGQQMIELPAGGGAQKVLWRYPASGLGAPYMEEVAVGNAPGPLLPGVPSIGTVVAGARSASISFTPSGFPGGSAVSSYTVTATNLTHPTRRPTSTSAKSSPITVSGLINDDLYDFTVSETNSFGTGVSSAPSAPDTPLAASMPPVNLFAVESGSNRVVEAQVGGGLPVVIGQGFKQPDGTVVGPSGNVYVSDAGNNRIVELPSNGGPQQTLYPSVSPSGIAVNSQDDVFVASAGANNVTKSQPGGAPARFGPKHIIGPSAMAAEIWTPTILGDVFVADSARRVQEIRSRAVAVRNIGTGIADPAAVAVDAKGDLIIVDAGNSDVIEVRPHGTAQKVLLSGLDDPTGVAVDPAGDVFVTDTGNNRIIEIHAAGGPPTTVLSGLHAPSALAVEPLLLAPTATSAVASRRSAKVSFAAPARDGGPPPTSYVVIAHNITHSARAVATSGRSSPITVPRLTPGDRYTFTVAARTRRAVGLASRPSAPVLIGVADPH